MAKNMCPTCTIRSLDKHLAYIRAEMDRWQEEEQKTLAEARAEEDRMQEEFEGLGYEQEPDC